MLLLLLLRMLSSERAVVARGLLRESDFDDLVAEYSALISSRSALSP